MGAHPPADQAARYIEQGEYDPEEQQMIDYNKDWV